MIHLDTVPMVLLASTAFPGNTLSGVLAHIRGNPGSVSCAVSSAIPMVGCALLRSHAKADMLLVQYKGQAPDVASGALVERARTRGLSTPLGHLAVPVSTPARQRQRRWHSLGCQIRKKFGAVR